LASLIWLRERNVRLFALPRPAWLAKQLCTGQLLASCGQSGIHAGGGQSSGAEPLLELPAGAPDLVRALERPPLVDGHAAWARRLGSYILISISVRQARRVVDRRTIGGRNGRELAADD
jgi:hypothetical protein